MGTKATTKEAILSSATNLFLTQGLGPVTMEQVAAEAGCTRRNLYRYYCTKEDLAFDVVIGLLESWNTLQTKVFQNVTGSGAQRLREFLGALVDALDEKRDILRFLGEFDFVFRDAATYHPDPEQASRFLRASNLTETYLSRILNQGASDGTLTLSAPVEILVPTLTTVLWGLAQRVALRDAMIRQEFGVAGLDLVRTQLELTLFALQTRPLPPGEPHGTL